MKVDNAMFAMTALTAVEEAYERLCSATETIRRHGDESDRGLYVKLNETARITGDIRASLDQLARELFAQIG